MYRVINNEGEVEFESEMKGECVGFCYGYLAALDPDVDARYLLDAQCIVTRGFHVLLTILSDDVGE